MKTQEWLGLIRKFLGGGKQQAPPEEHKGKEDASSAHASSAQALFRRLEREQNEPGMKRILHSARQPKVLIDHVIRLLFDLQIDTSYNQDQDDRLLDSFRRKGKLNPQYNVFYIYVARGFPLEIEREWVTSFYQALLKVGQEKAGYELVVLVNQRLELQRRIANVQSTDRFDATNPNAQYLLEVCLPCYFSFCRKDVPNFGDRAFIVGKRPLHNRDEINLHQQRRADDLRRQLNQQLRPGNDEEETRALLVATIETAGRYRGHRLRLNAHRFDKLDDPRPHPETYLYVGDMERAWSFTIGAADHDEIHCEALGEFSGKVLLNGLMPASSQGNRTWQYETIPELPAEILPGLTCHKGRLRAKNADGAHIFFLKKGTVTAPLLDFIGRRGFPQEIVLEARVLPLVGGQIKDLEREFPETERLALRSAIKVANNFWLLHMADQRVMRLVRRGNQWQKQEEAPDREPFSVDVEFPGARSVTVSYRWRTNIEPPLNQYFRGRLYIVPPERERKHFKIDLSADTEADGVLISYDADLREWVNPDRLLSTRGIVRVKCIEESAGRGVYALIPAPEDDAAPAFFAFQPDVPNRKWAAYQKDWLIYRRPDLQDNDLQRDDEGYATFDNERITAEEYSYRLICGSSCFLLRISGTQAPQSAPPASAFARSSMPSQPLSLPPARETGFDPTPDNLRLRLNKYGQWGGYDLQQIGQSNFAVHYMLSGGGQRFFLKTYLPGCESNARRESQFYTDYGAEAAALFIQPPVETLRDAEGAAPWGLIFRFLSPLEEGFPDKELRLHEMAAVGYGMATLLRKMDEKRMDEKQFVNFDIDRSTICFDNTGRLTVVDFDNVYPVFTDPASPGDLKKIIESGILPAQNPWLPPEARQFLAAETQGDRMEALKRIGAPYGVYLLAAVMLQLRPRSESGLDPEGVAHVAANALRQSAAREGVSVDAAGQLEALLTQMLEPRLEQRPDLKEALDRLGEILRRLAGGSDSDGAKIGSEITTMIGASWQNQA